ncbi:MAG: hypothetical protein FJW35_00895 [Acidobacteria bacterium]|nr:hypothetical protein [Acidobacteriota bacterium]
MMPVSVLSRSQYGAALLLLFTVTLAVPCLVGQEKGATQYTEEEYKAMEAVRAEDNPAQKTALVVKFFKAYPKSTLKDYVVGDFGAMMGKLQAAQRWTEITSLGRQVIPFDPDNQYLLSLMAAGYQQSKNYKQFVEFGEQAYQQTPTGNLAYYLAKAYLELGNTAKFLQWGETTAAKMPDNHEILLELAKQFSAARNDAKADKYARQCLKAVGGASKPEQMSAEDWKRYTDHAYATSYYVVGYYGHQQAKYDVAVDNLENSLKYYKRNDAAYYFLGQSYWQTRRLDMAMKSFAKSYLLNGTTSAPAKQHLDNLYRQTHNGSLTGLDRVIARAQEELK